MAEPESLVCKTMTIAISFPSDFLEHGMKFKKMLNKIVLFRIRVANMNII